MSLHGRRLKVLVPIWVAYGCAAERITSSSEPLRQTKPRHQTQPEVSGNVRATVSMYRPHVRNSGHLLMDCSRHSWNVVGDRCPCTWSSRCQVPQSTYHVLQALVQNRPTREQTFAFLEVRSILQPYLIHTLWPDPHTHPVVQQDWNLDDRSMARQYLLLCQRARAVAAHAAGKRRTQQQKFSADLLAAAKSWMRPARHTGHSGSCHEAAQQQKIGFRAASRCRCGLWCCLCSIGQVPVLHDGRCFTECFPRIASASQMQGGEGAGGCVRASRLLGPWLVVTIAGP